jgi:hypothetical protein
MVAAEDEYAILRKNGVSIRCRTLKGFDVGHLLEIYEKRAYGNEFQGDRNRRRGF